jgi:uncharacterized protein YegJ (DUF2314 family)
MKTENNDSHGKSQNNNDIEGPDDDSMDLNRARQLFNSEKNIHSSSNHVGTDQFTLLFDFC